MRLNQRTLLTLALVAVVLMYGAIVIAAFKYQSVSLINAALFGGGLFVGAKINRLLQRRR